MNQEIIDIAAAAIQRYAETHPRPTQVNMVQASEMLGKCRATIKKMILRGSIKLNECGDIPIEEIDRIRAVRS